MTPDPKSSDGITRSDAEIEKVAEEKGCFALRPSPTELYIDIDNDQQYVVYTHGLPLAATHFGAQVIHDGPSKSGLPHRHIVVSLNIKVDPITRIALQAALGSDSVRELLSIKRALDGNTCPTVFFEPK